MGDIAVTWASDLTTDVTGDIVTESGLAELQDRVIRRFLTTSQTLIETTGTVAMTPDYLFSPEYGGNARAYIGTLANQALAAEVQANLLAQASLESEVDPAGTSITVELLPNGLSVAAVVSLNSGQLVPLPQLTIQS